VVENRCNALIDIKKAGWDCIRCCDPETSKQSRGKPREIVVPLFNLSNINIVSLRKSTESSCDALHMDAWPRGHVLPGAARLFLDILTQLGQGQAVTIVLAKVATQLNQGRFPPEEQRAGMAEGALHGTR
jgi:hypothetical protein